ncbi:VOC family protein [Shewanella livingstonensis]|uniref:VOC family protein n=1 Tax=Shewanella livingstonensis TaxID=150120 RepID=A0A3G8LUG0_9GAMM|nr:VOC family protein [Shewanella livingstonensis]AZG72380.1 VOC family protein [Shewanella livingstonensis]
MCSTTTDPNSSTTSFSTLGIHHLGLSVPDIKQTAAFFIDQLHFKPVGEKPDYPAIFVSDGTIMLTLWQLNETNQIVGFDRHNNVGLHHFALKLASLEQLQHIHQRLAMLDNVDIEFAPEPLGDLPIHHMMCTIPGGIRLELIA